jgi:germination protein M
MKKLTFLLCIIFAIVFSFYGISVAASGTKVVKCKIYFPFSYYDRSYTVPENKNVSVTNGAIAKAVINEMLKPENRTRIGIGVGTKLKSLNLKNGLLTVDFSKEFLNCQGGSLGEGLMATSIVNTLTEFSTVDKVQFWVEGNPNVCLGHICLDEPVGRNEDSIAEVIKRNVTLYNIADHPTEYYLEPVTKNIQIVNKAIAKAVVYKMLYDNSLNNSIPDGTRLLSIKLKSGTLTLDLSKEFKHTNLGSGYESLMVYTIVNSLTEFSTIDRVQFLIEGKKDELGHITLDEPFERDESIIK